MQLIELKENEHLDSDIKLSQLFNQLKSLLIELKNRELPNNIIESINADAEEINATTQTGSSLRKLLKVKQSKILKLIEKELKIVPKKHYQKLWFVMGVSAIGLPIGVALGASMGNMGLIGIGMPIGMLVGRILGSNMDKKAFESGRQLNIEIKNEI